MEIVFVHPEIPHNTGCAARLAAALGLRLHLVEPLGFSLEDRYLKRAGLDYWPMVDLVVHPSLDALARSLTQPGTRPFGERVRLFSARGGSSLFETAFQPDDLLLFGSETRGLPRELLATHADRRVYVPIRPGVRSLNLANVACLGVYTAMQRAGLPLPDNDGGYTAHAESGNDVRPASRVCRTDA
jgi:tRNA (cytidine/uridine-2'-O-)-methyltransferase